MNEYESVCFCPTEWVGLFYVLFYLFGASFLLLPFCSNLGLRFASGWALYFYFYIYGKINMGNNGGSLLSLLFNFNFADSFLLHYSFVSFCLPFLTTIIIVLLGLHLGSITSFYTTVFSILSLSYHILYPIQIPLFSVFFFPLFNPA